MAGINKTLSCWMDPDYEQRLMRQINGLRTPTKNSPVVSLYLLPYCLAYLDYIYFMKLYSMKNVTAFLVSENFKINVVQKKLSWSHLVKNKFEAHPII